MNRKNLLFIVSALLLAALANWLIEEGVKEVDRRLVSEPEAQQDYYLKGLTIRTLGAEGTLQHRLRAAGLSHFSNTEQTQLQQPELEVYKQNRLEWLLSADSGELNQQQDEVMLAGRVRMEQPAARPPLKLTTSQLRILPKEGVTDTEEAVTLIQGPNRIDAVGMRIEQEEQRLLLLSQVRGRYETLAP